MDTQFFDDSVPDARTKYYYDNYDKIKRIDLDVFLLIFGSKIVKIHHASH